MCTSTTRRGSTAASSAAARNAMSSSRGPSGPSGTGAHVDLPDGARLAVDDDEADVAVGEREVHRPVDGGERLPPARVVEIVVADHAQVREGEAGDEAEVVLVPLARPRAGEVAEVARKTGGGSSAAACRTSAA
jgi:hypothetical protein